MTKSPNLSKNLRLLADLSPTQVKAIDDVEKTAIARFTGTVAELEAALGMLRLGHHLGWKPLLVIHNKRTIRKYEQILGINVREFFPDEGPMAQRSAGYEFAKKLSNFWKVVSGDVTVEKRREIDK